MRRFLVCLLMLFSVVAPVWTQDGEKITGIIQKIDAKIGTITIRPGKLGVKAPLTFSLRSPDIEVATDKGRARVTDLAAGNEVQLQLNAEEDVVAIRAEIPVLRGAITDIDLPRHMVHVIADDLTRKTFAVTARTQITQLGKERHLTDLRVHQWLEITASLDGAFAQSIEVHAPGTRNGRVSSGKLDGNIVMLDTATSAVLFHNKKRTERLLSFAVPRDVSTWLLFDDRPVDKLQGPLPLVSQPATIYLSPDRKEVRRIMLDAPLLRCTVNSVDLQKRRLTVNVNGETRHWELPVDVKLMNGRRKAKAEDFRTDTPVTLVLSLDRKQIRAVALAVN